jgi:pyruvate dehydrogenase (quinone)
MSSPNVSVFMLRRLREWGVDRIYGYPGDGASGLESGLGPRAGGGRPGPDRCRDRSGGAMAILHGDPAAELGTRS